MIRIDKNGPAAAIAAFRTARNTHLYNHFFEYRSKFVGVPGKQAVLPFQRHFDFF
jgi:hypothetical protein